MARNVKAAHGQRPTAATTTSRPPPGFFRPSNGNPFGRWLKGMAEISQEFGQFMQLRLQEDTGAWVKLVNCRTLNEAFEFQRRFVEKAAAEYMVETDRLSQIMASLSSASSPSVRRHGTTS